MLFFLIGKKKKVVSFALLWRHGYYGTLRSHLKRFTCPSFFLISVTASILTSNFWINAWEKLAFKLRQYYLSSFKYLLFLRFFDSSSRNYFHSVLRRYSSKIYSFYVAKMTGKNSFYQVPLIGMLTNLEHFSTVPSPSWTFFLPSHNIHLAITRTVREHSMTLGDIEFS